MQPYLSGVVGSNECCDGQNTKDVQKELKKETEELRSSTKSRKASHVCRESLVLHIALVQFRLYK